MLLASSSSGRRSISRYYVDLIFISSGGLVGVASGLTSNGMREMVFTASSLFECVVIDGSVTSEIE